MIVNITFKKDVSLFFEDLLDKSNNLNFDDFINQEMIQLLKDAKAICDFVYLMFSVNFVINFVLNTNMLFMI